jgi:hypothetical protein
MPTEIRTEVSGKATVTDEARNFLVETGFIAVKVAGRKNTHHSVKPYREATDVLPDRPRGRDDDGGDEDA